MTPGELKIKYSEVSRSPKAISFNFRDRETESRSKLMNSQTWNLWINTKTVNSHLLTIVFYSKNTIQKHFQTLRTAKISRGQKVFDEYIFLLDTLMNAWCMSDIWSRIEVSTSQVLGLSLKWYSCIIIINTQLVF